MQRWWSTCHLVVRVHNAGKPREARVWNILLDKYKTQYLMNTLYFTYLDQVFATNEGTSHQQGDQRSDDGPTDLHDGS